MNNDVLGPGAVYVCENHHFGGTSHLHPQGRKNPQVRNGISILLGRHPRPHIPEDCIRNSHRCENLKPYILQMNSQENRMEKNMD
jgi:hypothetical protein